MTDNPFFVYRHIRLDTNQPFYIGIGKKPKKFNGYRTEYKRAYNTSHRNVVWKNIVAKTNYKVEIIFESDSLEEVQEKEIEFISLYKPRWEGGTLVNLTSGGEFNPQEVCIHRVKFNHTEEAKSKIRESKRKRRPEVYDRITDKVYRCLSEACEILNLDFHVEYDRIRYKSKKARFTKLNS